MFRDKTGKKLSLSQAVSKITLRLFSYLLDLELLFLSLITYFPSHQIRKLFFVISGASIGPRSTLHIGCRFFYPKGIKIGAGTIVGNRCFLDGRASLEIGNHVDIASEVMIYNSQHDINSDDFHAVLAPVKIRDYVFIGPRSIILPGVTVGRGAIVAAGAVVAKDVAEFTIVGGIPARTIGERKLKNPSYRLGSPRLFQ